MEGDKLDASEVDNSIEDLVDTVIESSVRTILAEEMAKLDGRFQAVVSAMEAKARVIIADELAKFDGKFQKPVVNFSPEIRPAPPTPVTVMSAQQPAPQVNVAPAQVSFSLPAEALSLLREIADLMRLRVSMGRMKVNRDGEGRITSVEFGG